MCGYWVAQAIHVAAELGLADLIGKKPRHVEQLAADTHTHAPSLYRVLRALASTGIFAEASPQHFVQTPMGVMLRTDMPGNLAAFSRMQGDAWHWQAWGDIVESVRGGKTALALRHNTPNCFDYLAQHARHAPSAAVFNDAMRGYAAQVNTAVVDAYDFTAAALIVDVGGGNGGLLGAILECAPRARGLLFDRPAVLAEAGAVLEQHGAAQRCVMQAGNFFDTAPAGGDVYLLSSVLHDWDDDNASVILRHVRSAMHDKAATARVLVIEHVLPDTDEAHPGKFIDLEMMLVTGGRERTAEEYESLLNRNGFALHRVIPTAASASIVEARAI